jgi:NAD-dependent dihydropyrimidine dehydrogenase PreA subunit
MIYVDDNLCTGCRICVDACKQGALSIDGLTALIDETLCTSCGRCIDLCLTGAIILVETISECPPMSVSVQRSEPQPSGAKTISLPPAWLDAAACVAPPSAPTLPAQSKLDLAERALAGLLSVASFFLERRRDLRVGQPGSLTMHAATRKRSSAVPTGSAGCSGPRRGHGDRRGLGAGQGSRDGRGPRGPSS